MEFDSRGSVDICVFWLDSTIILSVTVFIFKMGFAIGNPSKTFYLTFSHADFAIFDVFRLVLVCDSFLERFFA
jgi:hypothetical protein